MVIRANDVLSRAVEGSCCRSLSYGTVVVPRAEKGGCEKSSAAHRSITNRFIVVQQDISIIDCYYSTAVWPTEMPTATG